jgi:hypothetical protein
MIWRQRIADARGRGEFTLEDKHDAARWTTCAVGEQVRQVGSLVIQFDRDGMPKDNDLTYFGGGDGFNGAVNRDDFDRAEHFLGLIEDRALVLKREAR